MLDALVMNGSMTSTFDDSCENLDVHHHERAVDIVKDLLMVSSFICSSAVKTSGAKPRTSMTKSSRSSLMTPATAMISLAPFWAITLILSHEGKLMYSDNEMLSNERNLGKLMDALALLMSSPLILRSTKEIADEVGWRLNQMQSTMQKTMYATGFVKVFNRLKKVLKSAMSTPLHFTILFGLSMHSDLNSKFSDKSDKFESSVKKWKEDFVELVDTIMKISPSLAMLVDRSNSESTPLAYAAAYRGVHQFTEHSSLSSECVGLSLTRAMVMFCPSSLAIADKQGLFPLHLAARRGHSSTMSFLCSNFPYTCPLRDSTGKLALHHALLSHSHHSEDAIVLLASVYPISLMEDCSIGPGFEQKRGFNILHYALKNCQISLYDALNDVLSCHSRISSTFVPSRSGNESCTTTASQSSMSSCSDLSCSEDEYDARSVRSSIGSEDNRNDFDVINVVDEANIKPEKEGDGGISDSERSRGKRKIDASHSFTSVAGPNKFKKAVSEAEACILLQFADTLKMLYNSPVPIVGPID